MRVYNKQINKWLKHRYGIKPDAEKFKNRIYQPLADKSGIAIFQPAAEELREK